ncbi:MAG: hypothetical protein NTW28_26695 [Candidatus Solibacter sp.]|nr:hypothetical protein [Candidatus Solibacter sp.]
MAHSTQKFSINNCHVTPNGTGAQFSRSASNLPDQAEWKNNDNQNDYTITLPPDVWELAGCLQPCPDVLPFTVKKGQTSSTYQVKPFAPTGPSLYKVVRSDGTVCQHLKHKILSDPDVIINI